VINKQVIEQKMKYKLFSTLSFSIITLLANAQVNKLRMNANIHLPQDSIECKMLISGINDFLLSAQKPNEENKLVLEAEKIETFLLLDEIKGIEKSGKFKDDFFYKPYLTNAVYLEAGQYLIQVSYIGTSENSAMLRASFTFIGHKGKDSFSFSSPLHSYTKNWKTEKTGNVLFHYQNAINQSKTKEYNQLISLFDKKLKIINNTTELYCSENFPEILKLIGVEYKSDYNGQSENVFNSSFGNKQIIVLGNDNANFSHFDPHDLWHDRLSLVISRGLVNKPVDEGYAYLYGGSWGISWKEIFKEFKEQVVTGKTPNWAEIKETPIYFKTKGYNNSADYIVNALLVQKIEKEKGFEGVWEFLNCGKYEKGNENYYKSLEKLTGITKANYNVKISELINKEK
jgi:hypothetical protein